MKTILPLLISIASGFAHAYGQQRDSIPPTELREVEVVAAKPVQRLTQGGLLTEVQGTPLSSLGTCLDVIATLPAIRTDGGDIEIIGKGSPLIYINGRRLNDRSELTRLMASEVRDIEVITAPGAKYGAEVQSVILIRTVRKQGDGLSGSFQATGRVAHSFSHAENLGLNYRSGGVDLFGGFNYDYARRYQKQRNMTDISFRDGKYLVGSDMTILPVSATLLGNIGINWQINSRHSAGARYEYSSTPHSVSEWHSNETVTINTIKAEETDYLTRWKRDNSPVHSVNAYYLGKTGNVTININNDYYHSLSTNLQSVTIMPVDAPQSEIKSDNRVNSSLLASKGTAEYELGDNTIEAGYEFTSTRRRDRFINTGDNLQDADDRINESTIAGFIAATIPIDKVELYGGLRFEHTTSDYYRNGLIMRDQSRQYRHWCPDFDITFPIGRARFTLSYTTKIKMPRYSQLSSGIQYDDRFTYETGNPHLVSETIREVSLAGIYRWVFFSIGYEHDSNAIISVIKPFGDDTPANIMTYANRPHLHKYNAVLSLSPRIARWSPRLRLNLLGQNFDTQSMGATHGLNTPLLFWNLYNSISLGRGTVLNCDITGRTRGDMDVVTLTPSWQINIGASYSHGDWYLRLQATDICRTARNSMITYGERMRLDKWNYSDSRALRLIARYTFNTAASKYKGRNAGQAERARL